MGKGNFAAWAFTLMKHCHDIEFRIAQRGDLASIIALLAEIKPSYDAVSFAQERVAEDPEPNYVRAFDEISADPNTDLFVCVADDEVIATLQVTYIPNLTLGAAKRALVEGVRVSSKLRGQGIGSQLMEHAAMRARDRGCKLIQLTTNSWREDAIGFYKSLGFNQTHVGLRRDL